MPLNSRTSTLLLYMFIGAGTFLMLLMTIPYFNPEFEQGYLLTKQDQREIPMWRWAFFIHISTSFLVLVAGTLQFSKTVLQRFKGFHRSVGKFYVAFVLSLAAPSGLVLSFFANGGLAGKVSFFLVAALWYFFTLKAFLLVRKGRIQEHFKFMVRSFALTLSALTLRTYSLILPEIDSVPYDTAYAIVAWLSWVPNIIVAELVIRNGGKGFLPFFRTMEKKAEHNMVEAGV